MGYMLQKHQMPGVDVRILYKGQNIGKERIERACRRRKIDLPFDIGRPSCPSARSKLLIVFTVQPSHIEVQVIPVPTFSAIPGTLLSRRRLLNDNVVGNKRTAGEIKRQPCKKPSYSKAQDDDSRINSPDLGPIIFESGDPKSLILPLELCKSQLIKSLDHPMFQRTVIGEPVTVRLITLLQSRLLLSAMDELLCWAYETVARSSRQALGISHEFGVYSAPVKEPGDICGTTSCMAPQRRKDRAASLRRATSRSHLLVDSSTGTISVGYSGVSETNPSTTTSEQLLGLAIAFMPRSKDRTVGISIMFSEIRDTMGAQKICPCIRTFNVIPRDSAIINSVVHNNLEEVRSLFASGEASPLDVDPDGSSLLSVHDQYENF